MIKLNVHEIKIGTVKPISETRKDSTSKKKKKKSFWFEYAENKGVNPHSSAWRDFAHKEKEKIIETVKHVIRFCSQCGGALKNDSKFCQRCGHRIRSR